MGEKLKFYLSLGLFSSFGVDSGTGLLMKTLAQQKIIPENGNILDAGCGTGVIAVSLKKRFPGATVTASDRDSLALFFTDKNAVLNGVSGKGFGTASGLLPGSLKKPVETESKKYDMIVSNIPAKAGKPVIKDFLQNCGLHLSENGIVAVVIVDPLAEFAEECILEAGANLLYRESGRQYSVFHFNPVLKTAGFGSFSSVYERTSGEISGFYGLPEFDSISYATKVCLEMLALFRCKDRTLIWNPGTGHIPAACSTAGELVIAGADLLQLKASDYNITAGSMHHHLPKFSSLENKITENMDYIIALPEFVSGAAVETEIIETAGKLLTSRGRLLVAGKSSDIARLEKIKHSFAVKHSIKYRGFRSLLLEKQ